MLQWAMSVPPRYLIFDTHPIQYRTPVFRALTRRLKNLKIYFFSGNFDGKRWWFHEMGKASSHPWGLDLRTGFCNEIMEISGQSLIRKYVSLKKVLFSEQPSAILIYGYYLPEHWMLWWLANRMGIQLVFVGETFSRGGTFLRRNLKKWLHPLFFSKVQKVIAIGKRTRQFYKSLGLPERSISDAKYCVDGEFFELPPQAAHSERDRIRRNHRIDDSTFVLLFVGRLFERKRPFDMLKLHQALNERFAVTTLMVGGGELESELKEASLGEKTFHLVGFQNQKETRAYLYAADLLVVPSRYETWGLVVNEAFSTGLPALVTDKCGVAHDLVLQNETGGIYPVGNISEAEKFVGSLIENRTTLRAMGRYARSLALHAFGVDQFADVMFRTLTHFYRDSSDKNYPKEPKAKMDPA